MYGKVLTWDTGTGKGDLLLQVVGGEVVLSAGCTLGLCTWLSEDTGRVLFSCKQDDQQNIIFILVHTV